MTTPSGELRDKAGAEAVFARMGEAAARLRTSVSADEAARIVSDATEDIRAAAPAPLANAAAAHLQAVGALAASAIRARDELRASARAREVLLASVSHDLRNPLNTFAMSAGLLRDDLERNDVDPARDLGLVHRMERGIERMQRLIEDLLEASRIEARSIEIAPRAERAAQLVREAASRAATFATEKGVTLTTGALDDDARVKVDRQRALQILAKVVAYAARCCGERGTIRLEVSRRDDAVVFTTTTRPPAGATTSPSGTALPEGRGGLALLIARGLVEIHGGAFRVEASDGVTIVFTLPAAD